MKIFLFVFLFYLNLDCAWYTSMGNNLRSSFSDSYVSLPLTEKWSVELPGEIISSPVIYDGKVFITTKSGYVIALNLSDGQWLWDYSTDGQIHSSPTAYKNLLFVTSTDGYLYAFDIDESGKNDINGFIKWRYNLNSPSVSSPLVWKGRVYVLTAASENAFYILSADDGRLLKKVIFSKPLNSNPSVCDGNIVFGGQDGRIYLFDYDGNKIVEYQTRGGAFYMKAISCRGGKLYSVPGYDERGYYVFRSTDLHLLYTSPDLTGNYTCNNDECLKEWNWQEASSVALSTSSIIFVAGSGNGYYGGGNSYLFFANNNNVIISSVSVSSVTGVGFQPTPVIIGDRVFFTSSSGGFYIFTSTGGLLYKIDMPASYSSPAFSDGYFVIAFSTGNVRCFKFSDYVTISHPSSEDIITSSTNIKIAYSNNPSFKFFYELSYSADNSSYIRISSGQLLSDDLGVWDVSGLSNGRYILRLIVYDSSMELSALSSIYVYVNNKPFPPSNLVAKDNPNDNCNRIMLSWNASPSPYLNYRIYRKLQDTDWILIASTSSTSYVDNKAVCGTTFTYRVSAYDGYIESDFSNESSAYSISDNPLSDNTPPADISDLSARKGVKGGQIILLWSQSGDDDYTGKASYYEVRYTTYIPFDWNKAISFGTRSVVANPGDVESFIASGLLSRNTYYFSVTVCDLMNNCSNPSNIVFETPQIDILMPQPPSGFIAYDTPADRGQSITLKWNRSTDDGSGEDDVYGYMIFRTTTPVFDFSKPYDYVKNGITYYNDFEVLSGVKYCYIVAAYDSTNISVSSKSCAVAYDNYVFVSRDLGGVIQSDDNRTRIIFDKTALNQDDYLIIKKIESLSEFFSPSLLKPSQSDFITTEFIYSVEASNINTKMIAPIKLEIYYDPAKINNVDENSLRIYYFDGRKWNLNRTTSLDIENKKISADISSFGIYGVFGYIPQGNIFDESFVYTYPNPAKGDKVKFKFVVNYNSDVEIKVYDVSGQTVAELHKKNVQPGVINEIEWNIKNIASGVYVYLFKAESYAAGKKTIKKKLAIVH